MGDQQGRVLEMLTLHVPFRFVNRGDRKEMQVPEGDAQPSRTDNTPVKAMARALCWKLMLESGEFATIAELEEREGIAPSYITRVLRLTLLAPGIVEATRGDGRGREGVAQFVDPNVLHPRTGADALPKWLKIA